MQGPQTMAISEFWVHICEIGLLVFAILTYLLNRRQDTRSRAEAREKLAREAERHSIRLEQLSNFTEAQTKLNAMRDQQISMLSTQSATLIQMAAGAERRLQMLENRA